MCKRQSRKCPQANERVGNLKTCLTNRPAGGRVWPAGRVAAVRRLRLRDPQIYLEGNSYHDLAVSRSKKSSANLAKARVLNARIGFVEDMPVECVEKLSPELRLHPLRNREGFSKAEILVVEGERTYVSRVTRHISKYVWNVDPRIRVRVGKSTTVPVAGGARTRSRIVAGVAVVYEQQGVE